MRVNYVDYSYRESTQTAKKRITDSASAAKEMQGANRHASSGNRSITKTFR